MAVRYVSTVRYASIFAKKCGMLLQYACFEMVSNNKGKLWLKKMVTMLKNGNVIHERYAKFGYMNCFVVFCIFYVTRKKALLFDCLLYI